MTPRVIVAMIFTVGLQSFADLPPHAYGHVYALDAAEMGRAVDVARRYLAPRVRGYHISGVWIEYSDEVQILYQPYGGPTQYLVLRKRAKAWHVTTERVSPDQKKFEEDAIRDGIIYTP
jgi:hypothetical protein